MRAAGVVATVVAVVAGGVALVLRRDGKTADVTSGGATDARGATKATPGVLFRERAAGVRPELLRLLDAWQTEGAHVVMIAADGGLRIGAAAAAAQAKFFREGNSKAATLADTPHGRGAALDVHPLGFDPRRPMAEQPLMRERFRIFGEWAEKRGFVWGGRWASFGPDGDAPHIEIANWRRFPMPVA